jgi:competence protein ComGC
MHIQSRADSDDVNGMMAMVMIAMMIVIVIVNIVPEAHNQVDSVHQHSCKTFQQLINFHQPNALRGKLNSSQCLHLASLRCYAVIKQALKEAIK